MIGVRKIFHLQGHDGSVYSVGPSMDNRRIYSGGGDHLLAEWDLLTGEPAGIVARIPGIIYCSCVIPEKNIILIGNNLGGIHVLDIDSNAEVRYLLPHTDGVFHLIWNGSLNQLFSFGADGIVTIWNIDNFECLEKKNICEGKIRKAVFNAGGDTLAIACGDGSIRLFVVPEMRLIKQWEAHKMSVNSLAFHPDGNFLLSGGKDAYLKIWNIRDDFRLTEEIPAHNFAIYSIVFNQGGKLFATGSRDKTIKIWDALSFSFLKRIDRETSDGHRNSVNSLYWSNYHDYLVSGSDDRTIMVWQISEVS